MSHLRLKAKLNGLMSLKGSWIKAIIAFSIIALLSFGISNLDDAYRLVFTIPILTADGYLNTNITSLIIEAVFTLISFFVIVPLVLGMLEWYWSLTSGKKLGIGDVFAWYGSLKLYLKSLLINLNIFVRCLLWAVLTCGIPAALVTFALYCLRGINLQNTNPSSADEQKMLFAGLAMLIGGLLLIGGILLFLYIATRYILAYFLIVEDSTRRVSDVIRDSIKYSRKYRWEITKFILSYIGWVICCFALLPILFVVPYFFSSTTIMAKHIIFSERLLEKSENTVKYEVNLSKTVS